MDLVHFLCLSDQVVLLDDDTLVERETLKNEKVGIGKNAREKESKIDPIC